MPNNSDGFLRLQAALGDAIKQAFEEGYNASRTSNVAAYASFSEAWLQSDAKQCFDAVQKAIANYEAKK